MNDHVPFTTIGDEPVEARIVAWVLGEASAFEAAELARLCDERPELRVFRRRMLALHDLLIEAHAVQSDEAWKLPDGKRQALDEILGGVKPIRQEPLIEKRIRHSGRRAVLAIAACVILTLIIGGGFGAGGKAIKQARKTASEFSTAQTSSSSSVRLETEFPPERIEGTPKPIILRDHAKAEMSDESVRDELSMNDDSGLLEQKKRNVAGPASGKPAGMNGTARPQRVFAESAQSRFDLGDLSASDSLAAGKALESKPQQELGERSGKWQDKGSGPQSALSARISRADRPPAKPVTTPPPVAAAPTPAAVPQPAKEIVARDREGGAVVDKTRVYGSESKQKQVVSNKPGSANLTLPDNGWDMGNGTGMGFGSGSGGKAGRSRGDQPIGREPDDAMPNRAEAVAGAQPARADDREKAGEKIPVLGALFANRDPDAKPLEGRDLSPKGPADAKSKERDAPTPSLAKPAGAVVSPVDDIRRKLSSAEGDSNLGKFDAAKQEHESSLRIDPNNTDNTVARDGLAKIEATDYYSAAKDQTRAELLGQVAGNWELTVPADEKGKGGKQPAGKDKSEYTPEGFEGSIKYGAPIVDSKARAAKLPATRGAIVDRNAPSADTAALGKAIKDQEDKVEEHRKLLSSIVRSKGIIYKGTDSFYGTSGVDEDLGARDALKTYQKIEQEKMQLESQINSMIKYKDDQLMIYASGLDLPDNVVKNSYPQYLEAKRKLEGLKINGLGDNHPEVRAEKSRIDVMKRQLDEGVANLRATQKARLDMANNRLKSVEAMKDASREESIKRGHDAADYVAAKKNFEKDQQLLLQLKQKLADTDAPIMVEKPKVDYAELMKEVAAVQEPYSTFSLNISDASFQVAQAALAKGERPDPAGIKVEQFYNAVDYGDPSPSAGEPVAVTIEQAAHPVIPGRNLVRVSLKTAAAGRSASQPLRLTLLVDQSGSMVRDDRRAAMDKALAGLAGLLTKNDLVTVVTFARTPRLLADGWTGEQAVKLSELVNQSASEGGTNLEEAIKLAEQLAERRKLAGAQNRIVLFTDGAANLGDADPLRLAAKVKALRQKGIAFDIAGIAADDLNDDLLAELARNGNGRYYVVGKGADDNFARQLAGAFRPAAENVKVQVHFNPERVGRYKLIGFEKDRLKTEDFRNDTVDAAELAAEEAGVAVYQVEPLPNGTGEIGDVSVRFRDTASGQMVERTWTIPHDAGVPAIDRAKPSMQLAVLAMLAAEKLRGGPLAEAIDFKQLANPRANVKRFFGNNGRVAGVLRMIDSL
jgi:Mg-chelatase subunit ChlD